MPPDLWFIDSWKEWYLAVGAASVLFRDAKSQPGVARVAEVGWWVVGWPVTLARKVRKK